MHDAPSFRALVDALPDAVIIVSGGTVAYANAAMYRLLATPPGGELPGRSVADLIDAGADAPQLLADALGPGPGGDGLVEIPWLTPDGGTIMTECAVGRVRWDDQWAVHIVARDVTQRTMRDRALRSAGRTMGKRLDQGRAQLGESGRRLDAEVVLRELAESDRDVILTRLALAEEGERRRLSRELHDEVGQHLTSLLLGLQGIIDVAVIGSEVDARAKVLHSVAQQLGRGLHDVAVRLRPRALDDFGVEAALSSYVSEWSRQCGVEAEWQTSGAEDRLPDSVETGLYRIAQEALTNVARHSAATRVSVALHKGSSMCRLTVEDNGKGFDQANASGSTGLGLLGMRERARLLGGGIAIESSAEGGTCIFVRIPIMPPSSSAGPAQQ